MTSVEEKIRNLEDEIRTTPYNKATQHHIGKLKAKLAKLKDEKIKKQTGGSKGFAIKKTGDATVGIVGFPSVGKSTLLNRITNANSKIASYDFTTLDVIPGMMEYKGSNIQLLDLPGIVKGAANGKGRGREIISVLRNVDLLVVMIDALDNEKLRHIEKELMDTGIRLNQKKPDILIKETQRGGIHVEIAVSSPTLNEEIATSIAREFLTNADIVIRENIDEQRLIDALSNNRVYIPAIIVINKKDLINKNKIKKFKENYGKDRTIFISAKKNEGLTELKKKIFEKLEFIRIYVKPPHEDYDPDPMILKRGATVRDACKQIHRDFIKKFRGAYLWGQSAEYSGQKVGINHKLEDGDIIRILAR